MNGRVAGAALLSICLLVLAAQPGFAARKAKPQLNRCPDLPALLDGQIPRAKPVKVPDPLEDLVKSSRDRLAVVTLTGATHCIDMRLKGEVSEFELSTDGRFLTFAWAGYEAQGYVLLDRSGAGTLVDTGVRPVYSSSRRRFAALNESEGSFGELDGVGVWQADPVGMRRLVLITSLPPMKDWRIDGWTGEDCVALSAVRLPRAGATVDVATAPRDRYVIKPVRNVWRLTRAIGTRC